MLAYLACSVKAVYITILLTPCFKWNIVFDRDLFLQTFLETKMSDFDSQVQSMNRWMNDTEKIVNSLHVGMDPNEVAKRVQQIKVGNLPLSKILIEIVSHKNKW